MPPVSSISGHAGVAMDTRSQGGSLWHPRVAVVEQRRAACATVFALGSLPDFGGAQRPDVGLLRNTSTRHRRPKPPADFATKESHVETLSSSSGAGPLRSVTTQREPLWGGEVTVRNLCAARARATAPRNVLMCTEEGTHPVPPTLLCAVQWPTRRHGKRRRCKKQKERARGDMHTPSKGRPHGPLSIARGVSRGC